MADADDGTARVNLDLTEGRLRYLLELDARMNQNRHIRLLTADGRVLLTLLLAGPLPVSTIMKMAGTSDRGFYDVLERLKKSGLIAVIRDSRDQRVRNVSVNVPGKEDLQLALEPS